MGLFGRLLKRERSLADLSRWLDVPLAELSVWRAGSPGWAAGYDYTTFGIPHADHLPQGAPPSPALSNLVNRKLDTRLDKLARKFGGRYTRYADDLTFSFPKYPSRTRKVIAHMRAVVEAEGYKIQMKKKVRVQRVHQRQTATGLVVNATVNAPRALRRKLRAMRHHAQTGRLPESERARLRGWETFVGMVIKQR